mmetsp:Transcript_28953/g.33106  ORF Transcript_28953/g.33106 Transcript_28953/m.33106 type:complete len:81 (+) Transcript_28953:161-403(+)
MKCIPICFFMLRCIIQRNARTLSEMASILCFDFLTKAAGMCTAKAGFGAKYNIGSIYVQHVWNTLTTQRHLTSSALPTSP